MNFKGVELVCPRCKGDLAYDLVLPDRLYCSECASSYPVILDIPDLRVFPDPYIDPAADIAKGEQLASHFQEFDFPGLVHYYYLNTQVVPAQHAALYTRSVLTGEARSQTSLRIWEGDHPQQEKRLLRLVEIGCGTGPLLRVAAAHYEQVVGVDIAFRWLIVAKKRLQEAGLDIPLICACAEALPFQDGAFDRMAAESTIEHVKNQPATISEAWRVLSPGAQFWIAAPNRLSLGPDPQLGVLAGGYLPASWIERFARRNGAIPPKRRLLSAAELVSLLRGEGFDSPKLFLMDIPTQQREQFSARMRMIIDLYTAARQKPIFYKLLLRFGPLFYAVAHKGAVAG